MVDMAADTNTLVVHAWVLPSTKTLIVHAMTSMYVA